VTGPLARALAWWQAPGSARRLAALRIGLGAILTVRLASGPYLELAHQPAALFRPISFMRLLDDMSLPGLVGLLQVVGVLAALCATVGLTTRMNLPLAWLVALPLMAMTSSLGKTVHNDVLLLLALVPLVLVPARTAAAWSLDAWVARVTGPAPGPDVGAEFGWPVRTAMVVVVGAYFFSGLAKLLHAGPAWVGGNLRWVLYAASDGQPAPNGAALFVADRPLLASALAVGTLVLELGVPVVLWRPRLAPLVVLAVAALHAGIWATMGLDYWPMAATAAVVLLGGTIAWPLALGTPAAPDREVGGHRGGAAAG
jgi:hypothetical protein